MAPADFQLVAVACLGIALAIFLIAKVGLHPFVGLLCGAAVTGLTAGMDPAAVIADIEKGFSDILRGTGMVVALGLGLGAVLQVSGGAQALAARALGLTGERNAAWGALVAAFVIGLPLFFETGTVLLLPIIAAGLAAQGGSAELRLKVMLSALAGLSVLHALLPPHPGPLIAVRELKADLLPAMTMGLIAAIPTALAAGPLLARWTTRGVAVDPGALPVAPALLARPASPLAALAVLLLPVLLIGAGSVLKLDNEHLSPAALSWVGLLSDPPMALLLGVLVALPVLLGRQIMAPGVQESIWREAMVPVGGIILAIGAGGALKQILVTIGLPALFGRLASLDIVSPLVVAWLVSAAIRLATGSATVATITASGIMAEVAARSGADPALMVLAIGAGSVIFSHVNDPGFWLVRGYLGTSTRDTFRTWSMLETAIAVMGLIMVLLISLFR
ncbi:gluconate permease [Novosphingobium flavum]|uniref:Gluconate permease n=1 Tax=Novosphingobium flavum TaxID=1778672 RepID=A0A7X1FS09_9SPHN|nr:gluconate:H+ symporter [Novosphingobium flavum]MBC2665896.1 gluconate permease [Novosphingobium flavum]